MVVQTVPLPRVQQTDSEVPIRFRDCYLRCAVM